jgi:hypothetical protein
MPASFNEPMNPFTKAPGNSLGDYMAARFNEPQNPFPVGGMGRLGCLGCLGDTTTTATSGFDLSSLGTSLTSAWTSLSAYEVGGIPVVWLAGGGLLLLMLMKGSSSGAMQKRASALKSKAQYLQSKVNLKKQYPGLVSRARRKLTAA